MKCPHCGAEHDLETEGRFCNSCGMSVQSLVKRQDDEAGEKEPLKIRCRYCGLASPPPLCAGCGSKLPLPDD